MHAASAWRPPVEPEDARLQAVDVAAARDVAHDVHQLGVHDQQRSARQRREEPHAPPCRHVQACEHCMQAPA